MDIFSSAVRLLENFSLKSFFALIVLAGALLAFERYTSSFQLSRIQKAAEVLAVLQQVEAADGGMSPELSAMHRALIAEFQTAVDTPPISLRLPDSINSQPPDHAGLWKFFWGALPWGLLSLVTIPAIVKREKDSITGFFSILLFAVIFGIIGATLPTYWPWLNVYLFPWGSFFGLAIVAFAAALLYSAKKTRTSSTEIVA